jgi:hypothetical protein
MSYNKYIPFEGIDARLKNFEEFFNSDVVQEFINSEYTESVIKIFAIFLLCLLHLVFVYNCIYNKKWINSTYNASGFVGIFAGCLFGAILFSGLVYNTKKVIKIKNYPRAFVLDKIFNP